MVFVKKKEGVTTTIQLLSEKKSRNVQNFQVA